MEYLYSSTMLKIHPCPSRNPCNLISQLHSRRNKGEELGGTDIPRSRSYVRVTIGSFSTEHGENISLEIAADKWRDKTLLRGIDTIWLHFRRADRTSFKFIFTTPWDDAWDRQDDGRSLNSGRGGKGGPRTTPQGYRMCLHEMKFWPVRALSFSRSLDCKSSGM